MHGRDRTNLGSAVLEVDPHLPGNTAEALPDASSAGVLVGGLRFWEIEYLEIIIPRLSREAKTVVTNP